MPPDPDGPEVYNSVSGVLHPALMSQFLLGIYTGIFMVTLLMYLLKESRTATNKTVIVGSTTALYALTTITFALKWSHINAVPLGETKLGYFEWGYTSSWVDEHAAQGEEILLYITQYGTFIIADSVLVWRCFWACGQSFRSSVLPISLLILETVLIITLIVLHHFLHVRMDIITIFLDNANKTEAVLVSVVPISVAMTSLVATFTICRQVYAHTEPKSRLRRRYRNVIDSLIQSSGLYSIVVLVQAALGLVEILQLHHGTIFSQLAAVDYTLTFLKNLSILVAGIAPTLMVARLAAPSSHEDTEAYSSSFPPDVVTHPVCHSDGGQAHNDKLGDIESRAMDD
ncbi:hypothetical protein CPC08DRAFT_708939 [Agrocybe pediades]|nr:hypothetical protein CPC08DRAFT_708939 [Agrocybe pediades]